MHNMSAARHKRTSEACAEKPVSIFKSIPNVFLFHRFIVFFSSRFRIAVCCWFTMHISFEFSMKHSLHRAQKNERTEIILQILFRFRIANFLTLQRVVSSIFKLNYQIKSRQMRNALITEHRKEEKKKEIKKTK